MTDHLRSGLEAGADVYEIPPGDLNRIKGRARRREQRRRRLTGSVAVLAVVAGTFTAVRMGDEPRTDVATEIASASVGDSGIVWSQVDDPEAALGGVTPVQAVDTGNGVFALSTAPGQQSYEASQQVVWQSADGIDWAPVVTPEAFWMTDLSASDGRLYAIGTGPATKSASGRTIHDVRVGWSESGGDGWNQQSLPLDLAAITEQTTWLRVDTMDVAAGPAGIVAVVAVRADLDVRALLGVEAPNGWTISSEGVTVLGDEECPEGSSSEDRARRLADPDPADPSAVEAGHEPDEADPADATSDAPERPNRVYGAHCARGDDRSAEEVHGVASQHSWSELDLPADLVDAVLGQPFAFHSADGGATFERVDLPTSPQLLGFGTFVEPVADGFTLVNTTQSDFDSPAEVEVLRSLDGRTWERQAGAIPGLQWATAIGMVDGNLAIVGHGGPSSLYAELHPDGWRVTSLADVLGIAVSDDRGLFATSASIGPLGVVVGVSLPTDDRDYRLLASRDGQVWSNDSVRDLTGRDDVRGVSQVVVRGDRVAVAVRTGDPAEEVTGRVALVGTPR